MRLEGTIGVATEPRVEKPCRAIAMPNNPLFPLLCIREDPHVLEAAPGTVSVLYPRALNLRGSAAAIGPSELSLGHEKNSCPRGYLLEVEQADPL